MISILTGHAKLIAKNGSLFDSQSEHINQDNATKQNLSGKRNEQKNNQSHDDRTFQNKCHVTKTNKSKNTTSGPSEITTAKKSNLKRECTTDEKMNREMLYHWGGGLEK